MQTNELNVVKKRKAKMEKTKVQSTKLKIQGPPSMRVGR